MVRNRKNLQCFVREALNSWTGMQQRSFRSTLKVSVLIATVVLIVSLSVSREAWAAEPEVITNSIGMKLVGIPAGQFRMGAEEDRAETLKMFPHCDPKQLD